MLFCREIHFATIYALSCGEKLSTKVHLWRKNDKYQVWEGLRQGRATVAGTGLVAWPQRLPRSVCAPAYSPSSRPSALPWLPSLLPRPPGLASVGWKCQLALLVRGWPEQEASAREGCSVVAG